MNILKQKLSQGKQVLGTWCELPSPKYVNILAKAGLDFVIIDMEHGSVDFSIATNMVLAANADNCAALIRVAKNEIPYQSLDDIKVRRMLNWKQKYMLDKTISNMYKYYNKLLT